MRKQLLVLVCVLLTGCGNGQGNNDLLINGTVQTDPVLAQPGSAELEAQLTAELQRQLKQHGKLAVSAEVGSPPLGLENFIFDLSASLVEDLELEEGQLAIELTWTEQLVGDYDQNGEVGISDIQPLVANFGAEVEYEPIEATDSKIKIPVGDPDGEGSANWRMARIDGDKNGVIGLSDVTPLAQHWQERVDGFCVLRKPVSESEFETLPNATNHENPTMTRAAALGFFDQIEQGAPRMGYVDVVPAEIGFQYLVVPTTGAENRRGGLSNRVQLGVDLPTMVELVVSPSYGFPSNSVPLEVTLDASSAVDPNAQNLTFAWDTNGDGEYDIESGDTPTITYAYTSEDVGVRRVGVAVTDEGGNIAIAETELFLLGALFDVSPKLVNPGGTVTVDFSKSMNPANPLTQVYLGGQIWEADPDDPDSLPIFQVRMENLGNANPYNYWYDNDDSWRYWVKYEDQPSTLTGSVAVRFDLNTDPIGFCQLDKLNGLPGLEVSFDASASHVGLPLYGFWLDQPDDSIARYEWDFGDGESFSSSEPVAAHQFSNPGTHLVTLIVTDSLGLKGSTEVMLTVFGNGNSWQFTDITPVNFSNNSNNSNRLTSQGGPGGGPGGSYGRYELVSKFELSEVYNHLAVAYTEWRDGELALLYTYSLNSVGTSWSEPVEVYRPVTNCQLGLIDSDGRPAIGFAIDDRPYFIRANGTEGSTWGEPVLMVDKELKAEAGIELMLIDEHPAAIICPNGYSRIFTVADDPLGTTWDYYYYGTVGAGLQSAVVVDGQPAFCAWYPSISGLRFNRAADLNLGPWHSPIYIGYEDRGWGNAPIWNELIEGHPACLATEKINNPQTYEAYEIIYHRSLDPLGLTWSAPAIVDTWMYSELPQGMTSIDGERPAAAYLYEASVSDEPASPYPGYGYFDDYCLAYIEAQDASGYSWSQPTVLTSFTKEGMSLLGDVGNSPMASMVSMENRPFIAYINPDTSMLTIASKE